MIYITSDTHIPNDMTKISADRFSRRLGVTEKDYLLICGDFGGVWAGDGTERYWLNWLDQKPFTTLFIDGNHENHRRLAAEFPTISFHGGLAHQITNHVFHLMRGCVFHVDGVSLFTMGGASSHDRAWRTEGVDWWPEELPNEAEYARALDTLDHCGWNVDYVVTHCAPTDIQQEHFPSYPPNALTDFLAQLDQRLSYRKWFFGHYHCDRDVDSKHICLYDRVLPIDCFELGTSLQEG